MDSGCIAAGLAPCYAASRALQLLADGCRVAFASEYFSAAIALTAVCTQSLATIMVLTWVRPNSCMLVVGLLCYMLLLPGRSPNKILFAKDSGRLFQLDLLPLYSEKGMVERIEVVPYRLTRNLATFFTTFGVEVRVLHPVLTNIG